MGIVTSLGSVHSPLVHLRHTLHFFASHGSRTRPLAQMSPLAWTPGLTSRAGDPCRAVSSDDVAANLVESALGDYPLKNGSDWAPLWEREDLECMTDLVSSAPHIWSDGGRGSFDHLDVEIADSGAFILSPSGVFDNQAWGHCQDLDGIDERSTRAFASAPGPLQTVQRAEYWGVILVLQAFSGRHVGIDNFDVLRRVAQISDQGTCEPPPLFCESQDGDLLRWISTMISMRGPDTVAGSKVKSHADESMVTYLEIPVLMQLLTWAGSHSLSL